MAAEKPYTASGSVNGSYSLFGGTGEGLFNEASAAPPIIGFDTRQDVVSGDATAFSGSSTPQPGDTMEDQDGPSDSLIIGPDGQFVPVLAAGDGAGTPSGPVPAMPVGQIITINAGANDLTINLELDTNAVNAPAYYIAGWEAAAQMLSAAIHNPITINLEVGYGEYPGDGSAEPSDGASAFFNVNNYVTDSYQQIRSNLLSDATSSEVTTAINDLPNTPALNGQSSFYIASAEAKVWGQISPTNSAIDGFVGFGANIPNGSVIGVALHEFTHAMGRVPGPSVMSLFRYTSPGVNDFYPYLPTAASYFSIDDGNTALAAFGQNSDSADFLNSAGELPPNWSGPTSPLTPDDPFNEFYVPGATIQSLTPVDLTMLDMLGFNMTAMPPPVVTATNQSVAANQSVPIGNIFSVSGSGVTRYQVWFSWPEQGFPADGTVTNNGTPIALDQPVTVNSLSGLQFTGAATPGTDEMWLRAFNGTWGQWALATLTDPGIAPPVVTATNQSVAANQSVPIGNIFSVSGSGVTRYQVWFSWPEQGFPADGTVTNNGTPIALDQPVTVNSLSGLQFTGAATPGTDEMWLRAFNGTWGQWALATLTDPGIAPPVVTATNQSVAANQSVPIGNIFSVSGSGVTRYQVWFSWPEQGFPADGTVTNNGTPIALDQPVTVNSLSGLQFTGAATPGTDEMWLRAFNGTWGQWALATLTDPGIAPPVVTATNQSVAANQSVPIGNIFSVSGSGVTRYQVWFSWPEQGFPADGTVTNNGTPIALDQPVTVNSLSGLQFTGAATPGTDEMWLRAFNGTWDQWALATLTDQGVAGVAAVPVSSVAIHTGEVGGTLRASLSASDKLVGFDEGSADHGSLTIDPTNNALAHSSLVNGGQDTLITVGDTSTILQKGVSLVGGSFFS